MRRVVITGMGLLTSIGNNKEISWHNLINKKSGIKKINQFDVSNLPASLLPSGDKIRNLFAQSLIVRLGGGLNRFRLDLITSDIPFVVFGKVCSRNLVEGVINFIL